MYDHYLIIKDEISLSTLSTCGRKELIQYVSKII